MRGQIVAARLHVRLLPDRHAAPELADRDAGPDRAAWACSSSCSTCPRSWPKSCRVRCGAPPRRARRRTAARLLLAGEREAARRARPPEERLHLERLARAAHAADRDRGDRRDARDGTGTRWTRRRSASSSATSTPTPPASIRSSPRCSTSPGSRRGGSTSTCRTSRCARGSSRLLGTAPLRYRVPTSVSLDAPAGCRGSRRPCPARPRRGEPAVERREAHAGRHTRDDQRRDRERAARRSRSPTTGPASRRPSSPTSAIASSAAGTPPPARRGEQAWAWPSCGRSFACTARTSGSTASPAGAPGSGSSCPYRVTCPNPLSTRRVRGRKWR